MHVPSPSRRTGYTICTTHTSVKLCACVSGTLFIEWHQQHNDILHVCLTTKASETFSQLFLFLPPFLQLCARQINRRSFGFFTKRMKTMCCVIIFCVLPMMLLPTKFQCSGLPPPRKTFYFHSYTNTNTQTRSLHFLHSFVWTLIAWIFIPVLLFFDFFKRTHTTKKRWAELQSHFSFCLHLNYRITPTKWKQLSCIRIVRRFVESMRICVLYFIRQFFSTYHFCGPENGLRAATSIQQKKKKREWEKITSFIFACECVPMTFPIKIFRFLSVLGRPTPCQNLASLQHHIAPNSCDLSSGYLLMALLFLSTHAYTHKQSDRERASTCCTA